MSTFIEKWRAKVSYINNEFKFGPLSILKNVEGQIQDKDGVPGYTSPTRVAFYLNGKAHGIDADIWGSLVYYYKGVLVPRKYILDPDNLTVQEILQHPNTEVRRVGIEIYGYEKLIEEDKVKCRHKTENAGLYEIDLAADEPMVVVQVTDGTPLPDGTRKKYFLQVPPTMKTCKDAIAWTFYKEAKDYAPEVET